MDTPEVFLQIQCQLWYNATHVINFTRFQKKGQVRFLLAKVYCLLDASIVVFVSVRKMLLQLACARLMLEKRIARVDGSEAERYSGNYDG